MTKREEKIWKKKEENCKKEMVKESARQRETSTQTNRQE